LNKGGRRKKRKIKRTREKNHRGEGTMQEKIINYKGITNRPERGGKGGLIKKIICYKKRGSSGGKGERELRVGKNKGVIVTKSGATRTQ